jgi:hypothetical protein
MVLENEGNCSAARILALLEQIAAEFNNPGPASIRLQVWQVRALLLLLVRVQLQTEKNTDEKTVGRRYGFANWLKNTMPSTGLSNVMLKNSI